MDFENIHTHLKHHNFNISINHSVRHKYRYMACRWCR